MSNTKYRLVRVGDEPYLVTTDPLGNLNYVIEQEDSSDDECSCISIDFEWLDHNTLFLDSVLDCPGLTCPMSQQVIDVTRVPNQSIVLACKDFVAELRQWFWDNNIAHNEDDSDEVANTLSVHVLNFRPDSVNSTPKEKIPEPVEVHIPFVTPDIIGGCVQAYFSTLKRNGLYVLQHCPDGAALKIYLSEIDELTLEIEI